MRYDELVRPSASIGKWWDSSPTIRLYHGTSSAMLSVIEEHGLSPIADLKAFTRELLAHYIPEKDWTAELLSTIDERATREFGGRHGDYGSVIFLSNEFRVAAGYAKGNCLHGGEVAHDVFTTAKLFLAGDDMSWKEFQASDILTPRFGDGKPVVLEVEVPKEWVLMPKAEPKEIIANMKRAWDEERPFARKFATFGELLDDVWEGKEFRVKHTIPTSMIVKIHRL